MNTHANTNSDTENPRSNDGYDEMEPGTDALCPAMADGPEDGADPAMDELAEILYALFVAEERRALVVEFREACAREFWVEDVLSLARKDQDVPDRCSVCSDNCSDRTCGSAPIEHASQNIGHGIMLRVFDMEVPAAGAGHGASQNNFHESGWEILDLRNLSPGPVDRESQRFNTAPPLCINDPPGADGALRGESQNQAAHPPPPAGPNYPPCRADV